MRERVFDFTKAPFPYAGGKRNAVTAVWGALGDVEHYVEPFFGSGAMLLGRPVQEVRKHYNETVNDLDDLLINAWRAIQFNPEETARWASWPVSESDLHARHVACIRFSQENHDRFAGDWKFCDPCIAGFWLWGQSSWISGGWCTGGGCWWPDENGILQKKVRGSKSDEEKGSESYVRGSGVARQRPHVSDGGNGVNNVSMREDGVHRKLPHVCDGGNGVNNPSLRADGVHRKRPHLTNERGVVASRDKEESSGTKEDLLTSEKLKEWFNFLSVRLRHVRVLHGDWRRAMTGGATGTLNVRMGKGICGVFLDPPYAHAVRAKALYAKDGASVSKEVREWCAEFGKRENYRIVLAGFVGEGHEALCEKGWREVEWYKKGFLTGGMANTGKNSGTNQFQERLWLSPACLFSNETK